METTWFVVLLQFCVKIFAFPVHLLWHLGLWGPFCKKAFPHFMARITIDYNEKMGDKKKELFSNLMDFASPEGELILLEIGTGTGSNFQFYPRGCRITCTDPNPNFNKFLHKSLSENPHLKLEQCLVASGEDLHQIPDASVDVVVSTIVLCSAANIEAVISEVLRVSCGGKDNQGGAFYFMEHVAGAPSSWMLFWQQIFDPTWEILFDGCHLTRETWKDLEKANFSELKLRHINAPFNLSPIKPHIIGYGVKHLNK